MRHFRVLTGVFGLAVLAGCGTAPANNTPRPAATQVEQGPAPEVLTTAAHHVREGHFAEATAIYEQELKRHPKNAALVAGYATLLHEQGKVERDPAKQRDWLRRARATAAQAEALGTTDPLTPMILGSISQDGRMIPFEKGQFSSTEEVDELMQQAEKAFERRDMDAALALYRQAYELQPTNYLATLFIGDVHFSRKDYAEAREWFGRAVALDADRETGHRYLGDALLHLGRSQAALNEWIEAVICDPYARVTRQHFGAQRQAAAVQAGFVVPRFPAMQSTAKDGEIRLAVDPDEGSLLMGYNLVAIAWREAEFAKTFPNEKQSRRSLTEEVTAIEAMLEVAENGKDAPELADDLKKWGAVLAGLRRLKEEGLLEAFILLDRADAGIAQDYVAYREQHRDALRRYVRRYWCGMN